MREAQVQRAEGEKQAAILNAEGEDDGAHARRRRVSRTVSLASARI
ncbi:MAG: hypothetical protein R3F11_11115 [Verrucomicrobiales bacterium]